MDTATGKLIRTMEGHNGGVRCAAWSDDDRRVASGSWDATVRIWDATTGQQLRCLRGSEEAIHRVSWSPDNRRVVGGWTNLRVWDVSEGIIDPVQRSSDDKGGFWARLWRRLTARLPDVAATMEGCHLKGHKLSVEEIAWSDDGRRVASASLDKTVRVWDASSGECLEVRKGSPDVRAIIAGSSRFPYCAIERPLETTVFTSDSLQDVAWLPDGMSQIATHPGGLTWGGRFNDYVAMICLEDPPAVVGIPTDKSTVSVQNERDTPADMLDIEA